MNSIFSTNLTMLRKQKGYSQKEAASALDVSQALLSHYEKGIRQCGLDFVIKAAQFYNVSTDYLLGVSEDTNVKNTDEIKLSEEKVIYNSINIIFLLLKKINSKKLIKEVSNYLYTSVYNILRLVSFSGAYCDIDDDLYSDMANAKQAKCKAKIRKTIKEENLDILLPNLKDNKTNMSSEDLRTLVDTVEKKMKEEF